MSRLLVVGGRQRSERRADRYRYDEARVVVLDTDSGRAKTLFRWTTPDEFGPVEGPSSIFKAASWDQDRLLLCTLTEVLILDPVCGSLIAHISHPWFNDIHHVARLFGVLHVVSTGLDALVTIGDRGEEPRIRSALEEDPWERFDPRVDYRRVESTQPHRSHPNFVFGSSAGVWLTRFHQRDAICLDSTDLRIDLSIGHPHDGVPIGDSVWFTTVNGFLFQADAEAAKMVASYDLNAIEDRDVPLGWARGVWIDGDLAYVGYSIIRTTRWRQNLSWVKKTFRLSEGIPPEPTRVTAYDLNARKRVGQWELSECGIDAVFGILPARGL